MNMETKEYIEAAKRLLRINSAELSRRMEISDASMSQYETGKRRLDDYAAVKLAELIKINPMRIITQSNIEREKDPKKHYYWMMLRDKLEAEAKRNKEPI